MKIKNLRYKVILALFTLALISSLLLTIIPIPVICSPSEGCYTVQNSSYARTFGIKNDYFGDAIFGLMIFLIIWQFAKPTKGKDFTIRMGTFFGALTAIYFIYLQIFVLHAFCKYCMVIDTSMILSLIVATIPGKKKKSKDYEEKTKIEMHVED